MYKILTSCVLMVWSVLVQAQCSFTIQTQIAPVLCFGESNGILVANVSGGTAPYSYQLNAGNWQSTSIFTNLSSATYTLNVKDATNCVDSVVVFVAQPAPLQIQVTQMTNDCNLVGSMVAHAVGGNSSFTFQYRELGTLSWINSLNDTIQPLDVGLYYQLQVVDNNGCLSNVLDTFIEAYTTQASTSFSCATSGQLNLSTNATANPVSYSLNPLAGTFTAPSTFTGLPVGQYVVTTTDAQGCSWTNAFSVNSSNITYSITHPSCNNNTNGSIALNVTGNAPINYTLNGVNAGSGNSVNFSNLGVGTYTIIATDASACSTPIVLALNNTNLPTYHTLNLTSCGSLYLNGMQYTSSGTYTQLLTNILGCDSVLTLNLTIFNFPSNGVTQNGATLTAQENGAGYQWLTCNPWQLIPGATMQNYTALLNGQYAVIVSKNGCVDTSTCYSVTDVSFSNTAFSSQVKIFPNPTQGFIHLEWPEGLSIESFELVDFSGRSCLKGAINQATQLKLNLRELPGGLYWIRLQTQTGNYTLKCIKE